MRRPRLPVASAEQLGEQVFGPAVFAFLAWLIRHPATARLDRLYFASREGWMLERLYSAMRERLGARSLPRGVYLPCSRRVMLAARLGAGLEGTGRLDVDLLTASSPWFEGSVEALLLARIGFVPRQPAPADAARIVLMRDDRIVHCVADLMTGEIVPHVQDVLAGFLGYAAACGLTSPGAAGLVDVGYSATIQAAIQHVLGMRLVGFYMAATDVASRVVADKTGGYAFGAFAEGDAARLFAAECGLKLEAVLTAPHGQVIGYRQSAPVFDVAGAAQAQFATLQRIHAGMLSHCLDRLREHGLHPQDDPLGPLRRFGQDAGPVAADVRQALRVEDAFCGNGEIDVLARAGAA